MNFDFVGNCDIGLIKQKVLQIEDGLWKEHNIRQNLSRAHRHTETIELIWDLESLNTTEKGKENKNLYILGFDIFLKNIKDVFIKKYGEGEFLRVLLVKLKRNSKITPHVDSGQGLVLCKRTHLPIVTNEFVTFTINDETKNLKEGEIWEINNQCYHSVENNSDIDRVHLIIDYFPSNKHKILL